MKKLIIVVCMMLIITGMLSGCTSKTEFESDVKSKTKENESVKQYEKDKITWVNGTIVDFKPLLNDDNTQLIYLIMEDNSIYAVIGLRHFATNTSISMQLMKKSNSIGSKWYKLIEYSEKLTIGD